MTTKKLHACNNMRKYNILVTAFIAGLLIICTGAEGADWQYYAVTSDEDMIFYYDADSINHLSGSFVQVSIREIYISETGKLEITEARKSHGLPTDGFENFQYTEEIWAIRCTDKMHKPLLIEYYNNENSILDANYSEPGNWSYIVMGSAGEQLYEILCLKPGTGTLI